jgi:pimeloyl-ACP methyl ester carboxylesterase
MAVSDALLAAAEANDHVAYELINGWSYGAARQLGGNPFPGVWMTGNSMRLLERTRANVLFTDLAACRDYAGGLVAAASVRAPALLLLGGRDIMAPPKAAQAVIGALADVRVITLPDCGHSMTNEQPDAVLDALRGFL